MVSAPVNIYSARTANRAAKVRVFVGPEDGSADSFTESFDLIPLEVFRVAGSQPDFAVFEWRHSRLIEAVEATGTVTGAIDEVGFNRQVYISVDGRQGGGDVSLTLFWGELLTESLTIEPGSQRITIAARIAPYHFGDLLEGERQWSVDSQDFETVPIDPMFNPLIDGVIEKNRIKLPGATEEEESSSAWVDPESIRTDEAKKVITDSIPDQITAGWTFEFWTLASAVEGLVQHLNGDFIHDPNIPVDDLEGTIWEDAPDINNVRLMRGKHLDQYLDALLRPYGYEWFLDPTPFDPAGGGAPFLPEITIFRRGQGIEKELKLQQVGDELDPSKSNTDHLTVKTDVGNLANEICGWGSHEQKELTIELFRGWPEEDDNLEADDLRRSTPEDESPSQYHSGKQDVWRLWVGNEAGDYNGTRTEVAPIESHLDLSGVFEMAIPRRRTVEHCLTLAPDGQRRIPYLEWSLDDGETWSEVPPGTWVVLRDQIGIRFTTDTPPAELIEAGDEAKVRITCTISGDERLSATSSPNLDESPSLRTVPLFVDLSDRYHKRSRQTTGDLASVLYLEETVFGAGADERDDESELQAFLADVLNAEQSSEMRCDFQLHGLHTEYEISDLITAVDGRDISLNRNKSNPANAGALRKYVQVYGVRWLFQEQATQLIVEDVT